MSSDYASDMKRAGVKSTLTSSRLSASSVESARFLEAPPGIVISPFWGADDYIDALDWIALYDQIATDYNWTATNKIARLGGYLKKHALLWYVQTIKKRPIEQVTWIDLKDMFAKRFATSMQGSSPKSDVSSRGTS